MAQDTDIHPSDDADLHDRLRRAVARYCPSWMSRQIDDIVQIAWMRLARARETSERNRDPGPTLIAKVAYCATVDEMRRHRRRKETPMDSVPDISPERRDDPHRDVHAREIGIAVRDCLVKLAPNRCVAVALYLQGHTAPETGRILGWTLRRTENLIFRGMADLRQCLAKKGMTP